MMLALKGVDDAAKVALNKSMMFADNKASYGTAATKALEAMNAD